MSDKLSRFICESCRKMVTEFSDVPPSQCVQCGGKFRSMNSASVVHMTETYQMLQYDAIDTIEQEVEADWNWQEEQKEFDAINKLRTRSSGVSSND